MKSEDSNRSRTFKDETYFEPLLGLTKGYTSGDVKRRYRKLTAQYHPDKVIHLGLKLGEAADEEMKNVNDVYGIIIKGSMDYPNLPARHELEA